LNIFIVKNKTADSGHNTSKTHPENKETEAGTHQGKYLQRIRPVATPGKRFHIGTLE